MRLLFLWVIMWRFNKMEKREKVLVPVNKPLKKSIELEEPKPIKDIPDDYYWRKNKESIPKRWNVKQ